MSKKNSKNNPKKENAWNRKFDDDDNFVDDKYSRTARKKAKRSVHPVITSLLIFLALIFILPTLAYFWWSNGDTGTNKTLSSSEERMIITENSSSELSSSKEPESESKVESEASSESDSVKEDSSESESEATKVEEPESQVAEEPIIEEIESIETETAEEATNTYTVQAGDNFYRIALNHNMTTDELKSLNGVSGDSISIGTVLKVK